MPLAAGQYAVIIWGPLIELARAVHYGSAEDRHIAFHVVRTGEMIGPVYDDDEGIFWLAYGPDCIHALQAGHSLSNKQSRWSIFSPNLFHD